MIDDDLVTLAEVARELGVSVGRLRQLDQRKREGAAIDFPEPALRGRTVRLWSMREMTTWWPNRMDGRRGQVLSSNNT